MLYLIYFYLVFSIFQYFPVALESDKYVLLYRGCYKQLTGTTVEMIWEQCQKRCFETNYVFAAIKVTIRHQ